PIDQRADIYALGLVLFEVFTGIPAFTDETPIAVALRHLQDSPRNPREIEHTIPDRIARAILRCLEKDPVQRFQTVEELQEVLLNEAVRPHKDRNSAWKNLSSDLRGLVTTVRRRSRVPAAAAVSATLVVVLLSAATAFHRR